MFYGKLISRDEVLSSLRLEIEKWPERNYRLQDTSINATCREGRLGAYVLRPSGDTFIIKEEHLYPVVEPTYTPVK